jgi:hypothetical protein
MKPLSKGNPLASLSPPHYTATSSAKTKILSTKKAGLDASTDRGLTERSGDVLSLDNLLIGMAISPIDT